MIQLWRAYFSNVVGKNPPTRKSKVVSTHLWNTPWATFTKRLKRNFFHNWRTGDCLGCAIWGCVETTFDSTTNQQVIHSNSHHQDCYIFSRESQPKPLFVTGILGGGLDPRYWHPPTFRLGFWLPGDPPDDDFTQVNPMSFPILFRDFTLESLAPPRAVKRRFTGTEKKHRWHSGES